MFCSAVTDAVCLKYLHVQYYLSRYDSEEEAHAVVRRALKEVMVRVLGAVRSDSPVLERCDVNYFGCSLVIGVNLHFLLNLRVRVSPFRCFLLFLLNL